MYGRTKARADLLLFVSVFFAFLASAAAQCGPGYYLSGSNCVVCASGTYKTVSGDSQALCLTCPAGSECPNTLSASGCGAGTYALAGYTACLGCPVGYACASTGANPAICAAGSYSLGGQSVCTPCPNGRYQTAQGQSDCNVCPAGYSCASPSAAPVVCPAGRTSRDGEGACTQCPAGSYQPATGQSNCLACPVGQYCPAGASAGTTCGTGLYSSGGATQCTACPAYTRTRTGRDGCDPCPAGYSCPVDPTQAMTLCTAGYWNPLGSESGCIACPAGAYCSDPTVPPKPCPAGYSLGQASQCTTCPAGSQCPSTSQGPSTCPSGTFSTANSTSCSPCPAGFYCSSPATAPVACTAGSYSLGGATACTACVAGEACTSSSRPPTACPSGYYSTAGATTCTQCSAGYICPSAALAPVACSAGTFSLGGYTSCTQCPAGSYCPSTSAAPTPCPAGTYSAAGATTCTTCPAGYYCASNINQTPVPCPAGSYATAGSSQCTPCPAGFACSDTTSGTMVACSTGSYSLGGATSCTSCPAGYYCPSRNLVPVQCDIGSYSDAGATACTTCPAGSACPRTDSSAAVYACDVGQYSLSSSVRCVDCPAGQYCATKTVGPVTCPNGFFSTGRNTSCVACPAGYECASSTSNIMYSCTTGTYAPLRVTGGSGATATLTCTACPAGSYCDNVAILGACTAGYYSVLGGGVCNLCPAGYSCATTSSPPVICAVGTWSTVGATACTACSPGFVCPVGSTSATPSGSECPMGGYCATGGAFTPCTAGTRGFRVGATSQANGCEPCPIGYYCPIGSTRETTRICPTGRYCQASSSAPTDCPAGRYNALAGQGQLSSCLTCPAGYYCPQASSDAHNICPPGYYCLTGVSTYAATPCPAGTYGGASRRGLTAASDCYNCTTGAYCTGTGTPDPVACAAGRYNPVQGGTHATNSCPLCPAGWVCPNTGTSILSERCAQGYYCPIGSTNRFANPCPQGRYTDRNDLTGVAGCDICPERYTCPQATGGLNLPQPCALGYYCPAGTGQNIAGNRRAPGVGVPCPSDPAGYSYICGCPPGTYGMSTQLASASECTVCPPGFWCAGASGSVTGSCQAGYYCPGGSYSATPYACLAGTYSTATNNSMPEHCTDCPTGSYCITASTAPTQCPAGTYTNVTKTPGLSSCLSCPAGYYCTLGTTQPKECGVGYHSTNGASSCTICPRGRYCPTNTTATSDLTSYPCEAGTFCDFGRQTEPDFTNNACPSGFYCPQAITWPVGCPAGTYNPFVGGKSIADCVTCPAGTYCLPQSSAITGVCSPGYWCGAGSSVPNATACVPTTYRNATGGRDPTDCSLCPSGFYCGVATSNPSDCPVGSYCPTGSSAPIPCSIGSFSNVTNVRRVADCAPCLPGRYCNSPGLTAPAGLCDPGYYCLAGSNTSAPAPPGDPFSAIPLPIGGRCPAGGYCPRGSSYPLPCEPGTFGNTTGAQNQSACVNCLPGYYCSGSSTPFPTGLCPAGYYCLGGSKTGTETPAPPGTYAVAGTVSPTQCPPGTRNPSYGASFCRLCDAGRLCNQTGMSFSDFECPLGSYCPAGSAVAQPCPNGTYRSIPGGANVTDCNACDMGKYCGQTGLPSPSGSCHAGYYCLRGSPVANPGFDGKNATYGGVCPRGFYCTVGAFDPTRCPLGTYNPSLGGAALSACLTCPLGYYCGTTALTSPTARCDPGFYCLTGAFTPTQYDCPIGSYCNGTNVSPLSCPIGTFNNITRQATCATCPARYYCDGTTPALPMPCPRGSYCPTGTGTAPLPCPVGTFSNVTGLMQASECISCLPGTYCGSTGLVQPTDVCSAGYVCTGSAIDRFGRVTSGGPTNPCPQGRWCPQGTSTPVQCPLGTYSPLTGNVAVNNCTQCDAGMFCGSTGLTAPSGPCAAGYYCNYGNALPNPSTGVTNITLLSGSGYVTLAIGGALCPEGSYCPSGSIKPTACVNGTFNNGTGLGQTCPTCPAGYWCGTGFTTYLFTACPVGYYCLEGTRYATQYPCPIGRYGNTTGLRSASECTLCPGGKYCDRVALTAPTANCSAGYVCLSGAFVSNPNDNTTGIRCVAGQYCPSGTLAAISCPARYYCTDATTGAVNGLCDAGYYCLQGASTPRPTGQYNGYGLVGDVCPRGSYCPAGSYVPTNCAAGTFNNATGTTSSASCLPCLAGYFCDVAGLTAPAKLCSAQYYCPSGTITPTLLCTVGDYCPGGDVAPKPCPAGTYNNVTGRATCEPCPAAFYCPAQTSIPAACPAGYYCGVGAATGLENACPTGTYSNVTGLVNASQCLSCPPGSYCAGTGNIIPTGMCSAGYYCLGGANTSTPTEGFAKGYICSVASGYGLGCPAYYNASDNTTTPPSGTLVALPLAPRTGDICPKGHYCVAGSSSPTMCPAGTFTNATGGSSLASCQACLAGYLCASAGITTPATPCPAGSYCPGGNSVAGTICPTGSFCPVGSVAPAACPAGYYQDAAGSSSCKMCPVGSFCGAGATNATVCPAGSYCPSGTQSASQFLCPVGTFNDVTGLGSIGQCKFCLAGTFCATSGLKQPTGSCSAGYICLNSSSTPTPVDNMTGIVCPKGSYCLAGATVPTLCPAGTFSNATGGVALSSCQQCLPGFTCPDAGIVYPTRLCDAGFLCPGGQAAATTLCPVGSYCPTGSASARPCMARYYQNQTGQSSCLACPAGFYCSGGTVTPVVCPAGSYCPTSTQSAVEFVCSPGTFSNRLGLQLITECQSCTPGQYCGSSGLQAPTGPCAAGFYCVGGANVSSPTDGSDRGYVCSTTALQYNAALVRTGDACPLGHYCPSGSSSPVPCPPGTFLNATRATSSGNCIPCTPGFICPSFAISRPAVQCPPGYICTGGNVNGTETPCPLGSYCPVGSVSAIACAAGTYADVTGLATCKTCPARYFCTLGQVNPASCPPGYWCPSGTLSSTQYPCPIGTYSNVGGLAMQGECSGCTAGRFCGSVGLSATSGACSAGYYCIGNATSAAPIDNVTGAMCPPGNYCPSGSSNPTACPSGTFSNTIANAMLSNCLQCLPGFTCPLTATINPSRLCDAGFICGAGVAVASVLCPLGSFCPSGSASARPCVAGTYQNQTGQSSCNMCPAGYVCDAGTVTPLACPAGNYCPAGTQSATIAPCPPGTYSAQIRLSTAQQCTQCSPGKYCGAAGLTAPTGNCFAGYYCLQGSNTSTPSVGFSNGYVCSSAVGYGLGCPAYFNQTDNTTYSASGTLVALPALPIMGDACPAGHYCPLASTNPTPCPAGTYRNTTHGSALSDCFACPARYLCPQVGTSFASRLCDAGTYCVSGHAAAGIQCPRGFFCAAGVSQPAPCAAGTYQDVLGQSSCKVCPAGSFCGNATVTPSSCPAGYACPLGTQFGTQFPCPTGRYSNATRLNSTSQCTPCDSGKFCNGTGLTAPSGLCTAGYHCISSASVPTPVDAVTGRICPVGYFCSHGTTAPTACPAGTFNNATGVGSGGGCVPCTAGLYCPSAATIVPFLLCPPGFFCPSGTANPSQTCPSGYLCRTGFISPLLCDPGTYQNQTGQSNCLQCPRGYYCGLGTIFPADCPRGYYCPAGTYSGVQYPCPVSTFNNVSRATDSSYCIDCVAGHYCATPGAVAPTGLCGPGHYCSRGASSPQPIDGITGGPCAPGYICGYGSYTSTPVPPINATIEYGYVCPAGSTCAQGAAAEIGCPPGTYQPSEGSSTCLTCPSRYFCPGNTSFPTVCPQRYFCPAGSISPSACPNGTYGSNNGLAADYECTLCPPTKFCVDGSVAGSCSAGYVCVIGNSDPTPEPGKGVPTTVGYPCPQGFYCPNGTLAEIPCSNGTFSAALRATSENACGVCPPGYTCLDGVPIPLPCQPGSYCPSNGVTLPCPEFTYNPVEAASDLTFCLPCPAGRFCNATGIYDVEVFPCPVGRYCPPGTRSPLQCLAGTYRDRLNARNASECYTCPGAYYCGNGTVTPVGCEESMYCPAGSSNMTLCPARFYCPPLTETPVLCPASHYCEPGSAAPKLCPLGTYCEPGSAWPTNCPAGTFAPPDTSNTSRSTRDTACITCPPGTYSAGINGVECIPCPPGYVCLGATSSSAPIDRVSDRGYPCPSGYYCPAGSSAEKPCPVGSFNALDRRGNASDCLPCFNGTYNHLQGQSSCKPCSSSAYTTTTGSTKCECRGMYRSFQMSDGFCVCAPGYQFLDEDFTVLSEADGEVDCQPIQFEWCPVGTRRLASGMCSAVDCNRDCQSGRGSFNAQMGICMCEGLTPTNSICDGACRASATMVFVDPVSHLLNVTDPTTNVTTIINPATDISGFFGELSCIPRAQQVAFSGISDGSSPNDPGFAAQGGDACQVFTMDVSQAAGFRGVFNAPSQILAAVTGSPASRRLVIQLEPSLMGRGSMEFPAGRVSERTVVSEMNLDDVAASAHIRLLSHADDLRASWGMRHESSNARARVLQSSPLTGPSVSKPITCLELGQSIAFQVSAATQTYPVYLKDSFLNSNPSFDYGAFRALAAMMGTNGTNIQLFAFTFTQNGTYVFASSSNPDQQSIVRVMGAGQRCPVEAQFVPMTSDNLVQLAIQETGQPVLQPNWILIGALIGGLLSVVVVVIGGLYYFRLRAWGDVSGYRKRRTGAVLGESNFSTKRQKDDGPRFKQKEGRGKAGDTGLKAEGESRVSTTTNVDLEQGGQDDARGQELSLLAKARLDPDDLDLVELIEKLKEHHAEVNAAFKEQQGAAEHILKTLRDEAEQLRKMIAAAAIDASAATMSSGTNPEGTKNARRAAVLRQIEAELAARALHDRSMVRREGEILAALHQLAGFLQHDASGMSDEVLTQLILAAGGEDTEDVEVATFVAANRRVRPENSDTAEELAIRTRNIKDMITRAINAAVEERERRQQGVPLWKAAAGSGLIDPKSDIAKVIEQLEASSEPVDAAQTALLELLRVFALGSDVFLTSFRGSLQNFIKELTRAREQQNPAIVERVRTVSHAQLSTLVDDLIKAIDTVLGRLPGLQQKLELARTRSSNSLQAGLPAVTAEREKAEETAEAQRISSSGASSLMSVLNRLIEQARNGTFTRTIIRGRADDWEDEEHVSAPSAINAKEIEDESVPDGHREAAAVLVAQVEHEAQREKDAIVARIEESVAQADRHDAQADEQNRQDAIRAILNDPNLTESERQRLLSEFEADQAALAKSLEMERQRQAAELARRLEEKKREKLARKLRMAEAKAAADAEARAKAEMDALLRAQEEERRKQWEQLQKQAEQELSSTAFVQAAANDTTFSVESQLAQLRERYNQEAASVEAALDTEKRRQAASLQAKLKERRERKMRALKSKQLAQLAGATSDLERAQLLDNHVVELAALEQQLAAEEEADITRAQANTNAMMEQAVARGAMLQQQLITDLTQLQSTADAEKASKMEAMRRTLAAERNQRLKELHTKHSADLSRAETEEDRSILRARQAAELAALECELDLKEERELAAVDGAAAAAGGAIAAAQLEEQLARLRKQHEIEVMQAEAARDLERARQSSALQRKLAARREKRLLELQRDQARELDGVTDEAQRAKISERHSQMIAAVEAELGAADERDEAQFAEASQADEVDYEGRLAAIHAAHVRDITALDAATETERNRQRANAAAKLAERKAKRDRAARKRHETQLANASDELARRAIAEVHVQDERALVAMETETAAQVQKECEAMDSLLKNKLDVEAEFARVRALHELESSKLDDSMKLERARQEAALQRKLAQRRNRKQTELLKKQAEEASQAAAAGANLADQAELKREHAAQIVALEEEIAKEEATEAALVQQEIRLVESSVESKKRMLQMNAEEELAKIHDQFESERERLMASVQGEQRRQRATLEAKLAQRNARKMRQLALQQQEAILRAEDGVAKQVADAMSAPVDLEENAAAQRLDEAVKQQLQFAGESVDRETQQRQAELEAENVRRRRELEAKQEEERRRLEAEAKAETEARAREEEAARKAKLEAKRREMELKVQAMNLSTSEEVERVRKEHEAELAQYEASTEEERRRQKDKLEKQLEARRAKKARELKRKQEEEMAAELARQQQAAAALAAEAAAKREKEAVQMALSSQPDVLSPDAAGEAIESLMQKRHADETAELIARQYTERAKALKTALEVLFERKREEQSDVMEALREAGATEQDMEAALQTLQRKYEAEKARTERAVVEDIEVRHAKEQLDLRQRQLAELANAFKELAPEDVLRRHEAEEASREASKLKEFQSQMLKEKEDRLARIKEEKEQFEAQLRRQNEEEMLRLESEHQAQLAEERRRAEEQLKLRKDRLMREQDELKRKKMEESADLDLEARDRIMKEFEENQSRMEAKLDVVRSQQQAKLEAKLAQRKEKQKRMKERELAEKLRDHEAQKNMESAAASEAAARASAEAEARRKAEASAKAAAALSTVPVAAAAMRAAVEKTVAKAASVLKRTGSEKALDAGTSGDIADSGENTLRGSKGTAMLEKRLAQVETLLQKVAEHAKLQAKAVARGPGGTIAYIDPSDALTPTEGTLVAADATALSSREALRFNFAQRLLQALGLSDTSTPVRLMAARSLPHNNYANNAFRNSIYFDQSTNTLYLRAARLQSAGDTMLVIAHAAAHIRINRADLSNDFEPRFISEFHKCVRACAQDLFKQTEMESKMESSTSKSPAGPASTASMATRALSPRGGPTATPEKPSSTAAASARDKLQKGIVKLKSLRTFGLSSRNLLDTAQAAVEVSRGVADTDAVVEATAGSALAWQTGTLPDRMSRLKALAKKDFLQKYLHQLETEIVEFDEHAPMESPGAAVLSADELAVLADKAMEEPLSDNQTATVEAYRQNLQQNIAAIQDSLDRGQQLYLSRASARDEAKVRVTDLESLLDGKQATLQRVLRMERRQAAVMDGLLADMDDDDESDDDDEVDPSSLPRKKDLQADIDVANRQLAEARAALQKAEDALSATNARLQKLQEQLTKAQQDLARVSSAKGNAAYELATAASRAAAVAAQASMASPHPVAPARK